jgi:hypothetical protein
VLFFWVSGKIFAKIFGNLLTFPDLCDKIGLVLEISGDEWGVKGSK